MRKQYMQPIVQSLPLVASAHLCAGSPGFHVNGSVVSGSGGVGNPGDAL